MKQAVILAGGKGTRLQERLGDLPKPMIPIGGRPLIAHQLALCRQHGFSDVVLLLGHGAEHVQRYVRDGSDWDIRVRSMIEPGPLGTAGAVFATMPSLADRFLVLYGDLLLNVDLDRLWQTHESRRADAALVLHPNDHPFDSDLVEIDSEEWIRAFHPRPRPEGACFQNLVNAALYVANRAPLEPWVGAPTPLDFGQDIFPAMLARGGRLLGYRSQEYIKDIGTPERYDRVCAEYKLGVVERSSLDRPQVAVFLDRDGTLNEEVGGVTGPDQLRLLPGVGEAIRRLNHHGVRVVVVTNQPVVAKGFCTEADVEAVHRKLESLLGLERAFLDRLYYCPHHPERGFPGERPDLKIDCACRKPKPGMVQRAAIDLNIDLNRSWLVGDSTVDMATARHAGLRSILVRTGHRGLDGRMPAAPDQVFETLSEAVGYILKEQGRTP